MSASFAFLSPDEARAGNGFAPALRSPVAGALAGGGDVEDLSLRLGKLDVYGAAARPDVPGADVLEITPGRHLVLLPYERAAAARAALAERGLLVIDRTGALAAVRVRGEQLLRRLTELDLERLPATGLVAGVRTVLLREGDAFVLLFGQEYADSVLEAVLDTQEGIR